MSYNGYSSFASQSALVKSLIAEAIELKVARDHAISVGNHKEVGVLNGRIRVVEGRVIEISYQ